MARATSKAEVLRRTRETLATAQRGLADVSGDDPGARASGLHNVAVFGRSVSLVLQNMRSVDREGFNAWYRRYAAQMDGDPLMNYFRDLRNEILKEGPPATTGSVQMPYLDSAMVARLQQQAPPGTRATFIGDPLGGSGFEVALPDGTIEKYYISLPEEWGAQVTWNLPEPPDQHLGQPIRDQSPAALCQLYLAYLSDLVASAEAHFAD